MLTLFPDAEADIAAAMDDQPFDLEAALEGKKWEARIEKVDRWLDFCALQVLARHGNDHQRTKFITIHWTLCRAFEALAWDEVDSIIDAMEREFR